MSGSDVVNITGRGVTEQMPRGVDAGVLTPMQPGIFNWVSVIQLKHYRD